MSDEHERTRSGPIPARAKDARTEQGGRRATGSASRRKWVDLQIQQAMARGEFDDLPGAGKPIRGPRQRSTTPTGGSRS